MKEKLLEEYRKRVLMEHETKVILNGKFLTGEIKKETYLESCARSRERVLAILQFVSALTEMSRTEFEKEAVHISELFSPVKIMLGL